MSVVAERARRWLAPVMALVLTAVGFCGLLLYGNGITVLQASHWVTHTHQVIGELEGIHASLTDAESAQRGFVITGDPLFLQRYGERTEAARVRVEKVRELVADNPTQQERIQALNESVERKLAEMDAIVRSRRQSFAAAANRIETGTGPRLMDDLRTGISAMSREEQRLLATRRTQAARSVNTLIVTFWSTMALFAGLLLTLALLAQRTLKIIQEARQSELAHREELERRVERRTADLRAANDELESFSYSVSHDLRGPLRHVAATSEGLREDLADRTSTGEEAQFQLISTSIRRMSELIDDLLKLAQTTRGELQLSPVDLSEVAREAFHHVSLRHPRDEVEVVVQEGVVAPADVRMISILLDNLVRNAWKYSSKSPSARMEFGETETEGSRVFFVRDNGVGFDPAKANRLFEPFQRLHTDKEFEGSGIGLAICKRIVQRHGGRIWAESAPGLGATFFFTLPNG